MARIDLGKVVGDSATISVGNVTTLEAGENATVVNTGTELNGVFDFGIPKGPKGDKGDTGSQGPVGPQGVQGKPFTIDKTYSSVLDMEADFNNMEVGSYVMIASNVESEDNARLYYRDTNEWKFISDFSGATGIQGEQGPQGQAGYTPVKGVDYFTSEDIAEIEGDIKDITGELANLDTTDKTNLVSAINEVASAGGGEQIPTLVLDEPYRFNPGSSVTDTTMLSFFSTRITEMLTETPKKGLILIEYNNSGKSELWCCTENVSSQSTQYNFYLVNTEIKSANHRYALVVRGAWANDIFTCSYIMTAQDSYAFVLSNQVLTKTNNDSYTPTSNYHPATKKYVDDRTSSAQIYNKTSFEIRTQATGYYLLGSNVGTLGYSGMKSMGRQWGGTSVLQYNVNAQNTFAIIIDKNGKFYVMGYVNNVWRDIEGYLLSEDNQTISGKKTFNTLPEASSVPTTDDQLVNKKYVDDSIATAITTTLGGSY